MTILTSIILVAAIVLVAAFIAYQMQKGTKPMSEFKADFDNNAEVQELVELTKELYNKDKLTGSYHLPIGYEPSMVFDLKDLRPIVAKKAPKTKKPEFPIDQPVKEEKVTEISQPVVTVNVEVAKPKKKRKYYPKKKKTQE
jgi:hypothetical protein